MMPHYFISSPNTALTVLHQWFRSEVRPGFWYVIGSGDFTASGWAVVDDFGSLVRVP